MGLWTISCTSELWTERIIPNFSYNSLSPMWCIYLYWGFDLTHPYSRTDCMYLFVSGHTLAEFISTIPKGDGISVWFQSTSIGVEVVAA